MTTILWQEAIPSSTSLVAQAPAFWHSEMTSIAQGVATSLFWDGSGGASAASRGLLRPGASRAFFALDSASSNIGGVGRAFFTSDFSDFLLYESNATFRVGSPTFLDYGSGASLGFAPSNVSLFRELSGFTTVSDITIAGLPQRFVSIVGSNFNATQQFCSVICSERSVLFNVFERNPTTTGNIGIYYQALDNNCPSTATFYWTVTMLMRGINDPSGVAL